MMVAVVLKVARGEVGIIEAILGMTILILDDLGEKGSILSIQLGSKECKELNERQDSIR